jgi:hypothetical protein
MKTFHGDGGEYDIVSMDSQKGDSQKGDSQKRDDHLALSMCHLVVMDDKLCNGNP